MKVFWPWEEGSIHCEEFTSSSRTPLILLSLLGLCQKVLVGGSGWWSVIWWMSRYNCFVFFLYLEVDVFKAMEEMTSSIPVALWLDKCTIVPLFCGFVVHSFSYLWSAVVWKILNGNFSNNSNFKWHAVLSNMMESCSVPFHLRLAYSKEGKYNIARNFERGRDHIYITYTEVYCCILLLVIDLLLCQTYKLHHRYVYIVKTGYVGLSSNHDSRHPQGLATFASQVQRDCPVSHYISQAIVPARRYLHTEISGLAIFIALPHVLHSLWAVASNPLFLWCVLW